MRDRVARQATVFAALRPIPALRCAEHCYSVRRRERDLRGRSVVGGRVRCAPHGGSRGAMSRGEEAARWLAEHGGSCRAAGVQFGVSREAVRQWWRLLYGETRLPSRAVGDRIVELARAGKTAKEIASIVGQPARAIYALCRSRRVTLTREPVKIPDKVWADAMAAVAAGATLIDAAVDYGVSEGRLQARNAARPASPHRYAAAGNAATAAQSELRSACCATASLKRKRAVSSAVHAPPCASPYPASRPGRGHHEGLSCSPLHRHAGWPHGRRRARRDGGLFPEILRTELHGARATIEAYSKRAVLAGYEEASACGLRFGDGAPARLRVTTRTGSRFEYMIDRWD